MAARGISSFDLRRQPMKFVCFSSGASASLTGANGLIRRLRLPSLQLQKVRKPVDLKVSARLGHHTKVKVSPDNCSSLDRKYVALRKKFGQIF
ncbi:hypothetical protein TNCV_2098881 [Trichonephila clavipes]|nr:hypothetical protein TNCV_2098881 [Trichonephila clavipes]